MPSFHLANQRLINIAPTYFKEQSGRPGLVPRVPNWMSISDQLCILPKVTSTPATPHCPPQVTTSNKADLDDLLISQTPVICPCHVAHSVVDLLSKGLLLAWPTHAIG